MGMMDWAESADTEEKQVARALIVGMGTFVLLFAATAALMGAVAGALWLIGNYPFVVLGVVAVGLCVFVAWACSGGQGGNE